MKHLTLPLMAAGALNSAGFIIDGNATAAFAAFAATVLITLGVVKWIDGRIEAKLAHHARVEGWEHRAIIQQISNLRTLLGHPPLSAEEILAQTFREREKLT